MGNITTYLYFLSITLVIWNIIEANLFGLFWILGKKKILDKKVTILYNYISWFSFVLLFITGFLLYWPERSFLLFEAEFYVKIIFFVAIFINCFVIFKLSKYATSGTFKSLNLDHKIPLLTVSLLSSVSWGGAALALLMLKNII